MFYQKILYTSKNILFRINRFYCSITIKLLAQNIVSMFEIQLEQLGNPLFAIENEDGGLFIQGFEDRINFLIGTENPDVIIGGNQDDFLFGLDESDIIDGDLGGSDFLNGGSGNDVISGLGADTLIGGSGNDSFIFVFPTSGVDEIPTIVDFVVGEDSLGILGINQGDNADYNRDTGIISVNGQDIVDVGRELPLSDRNLDFDSLTFNNDDLIFAGEDLSVGSGTDGVEDVFVFSRETLNLDVIVPIENFVPGEDTIRLEGTSSGDNVDYNRSTGVLSINGEAFAQIDPELPLDKNRDFDFV